MNDAVPVVQVENVSKSYGRVVALDDVSISLDEGEVTALVGDNGAGKSTLVSILSGVRQPDEGVIRLLGEPVRLESAHRAQSLGIATVFQNLALVERRDVAANLFLGREPRHYGLIVDRRRMQRDAAAVIKRLGVGLPTVRALVGDLSGGQRQAVAVARAVLHGGRVILLDEPTAALGIREGRRVMDLIQALRAQGQTILLVSHNIASVFELADRIVVLRHGRVVAALRTEDTTQDGVVGLIVGAHSGSDS
jgi:ABC-type sugar transport system ATPase subunit